MKPYNILLLATLFISGILTSEQVAAAEVPFFSSYPVIDTRQWHVSNGWSNGGIQSCEWLSSEISGDDGNLKLQLSDNGGKVRPYGCAEIQSAGKTGYGLYEARMRTAAGSGLNTAFFTYVGPQHDEIDFEFLGKNPHTVQINYYTGGKGGHEVIIPLAFDASKEFHTYSFSWKPEKITWFVDGKKVHETPVGANLPTHPCLTILSLWSGSSMVNGWLGPFAYQGPVAAEVASVKYTADK